MIEGKESVDDKSSSSANGHVSPEVAVRGIAARDASGKARVVQTESDESGLDKSPIVPMSLEGAFAISSKCLN
jgi:hypothetical protein